MNDYLDQINVNGVLYSISGGTGSGVTPAEVQEMINQSISGLSGDTHIISGDVITISGDVITISGDVIELAESLDKVSGDVVVLSGDVIALESNLSGKTDTSAFTAHTSDATIHLTSGDVQAQMSAYTYDRQTIDDKIISGGTFDPTLYYKKTETSAKTELDAAFSAITKVIEDNEQVVSEALNDLNDRKVESGDVLDIVSGYTYDKDTIDSKIASGGTSGITSGEVQTMLEDYTYDKETIDDKISSGGGSSSAVTVLSGDVITLSGDVITISGDVIELSESLDNVSGDVIVLSGDVSGLEGKIDALSGALDDKQDKLISGTNIKTINGQSLLGSGNIEISGGTGGKAIVAGRGIKVTTGETADTVAFDLPIYTAMTRTPRELPYTYLKTTDGLLVSTSENDKFYQGYERKFAVGQGWSGQTAYDFLVDYDGKIYIDDYKDVTQYGNRNTYCLQDKLDSLQPILSAGTGVDITDNVISVTGGGESSGITSGDVQTMIDQSISGKADNADLVIVSGDVIALSGAVIDNEEVVARALNDLNDKKTSSGDVVDIVSAYTYDKSEIDEKIASGGGITSGDVQAQIDSSISGKADNADLVIVSGDVRTLSGNVNNISANTLTGVGVGVGDRGKRILMYEKNGEWTEGNTMYRLGDGLKGDPSDYFLISADMDYINAHITGGGITSGDVVDIVSGYTYDKEEINSKINNAISEVIIDVDNTVSAETQPIKNDIALIKSKDVTNVTYDSTNKVINFYNTNGVLVDSIDATDFIKDGMVQDVQIVTVGGVSYLRITFNTESGQENIDIDLSQIFDANNYYTKTEVNNIISNKIQCLSEAEWARTSGSTQSDVLYLIY